MIEKKRNEDGTCTYTFTMPPYEFARMMVVLEDAWAKASAEGDARTTSKLCDIVECLSDTRLSDTPLAHLFLNRKWVRKNKKSEFRYREVK